MGEPLTTQNFAANFANVLCDERVQHSILQLFEPMIALTIEEKFNTILKSKLDGLFATTQSLRDDLKVRDETINKLQSETIKLKQEISRMKKDNDSLEQFTRKDNLIISGIPASFAERVEGNESTRESSTDTTDKVIKLCKDHLNCEITPDDISTAHRLSGNASAQILVRFVRRSVRDKVYNARFGLKGFNSTRSAREKVFINEDLSPFSRSIFSAAWKAKGRNGPIENVFTRNCQVFAKIAGTLGPVHIDSLAKLHSIQVYRDSIDD